MCHVSGNSDESASKIHGSKPGRISRKIVTWSPESSAIFPGDLAKRFHFVNCGGACWNVEFRMWFGSHHAIPLVNRIFWPIASLYSRHFGKTTLRIERFNFPKMPSRKL